MKKSLRFIIMLFMIFTVTPSVYATDTTFDADVIIDTSSTETITMGSVTWDGDSKILIINNDTVINGSLTFTGSEKVEIYLLADLIINSDAVGISNNGELIISGNGNLTLNFTGSNPYEINGIYSSSSSEISTTGNITINGFYRGIYSNNNIFIAGSGDLNITADLCGVYTNNGTVTIDSLYGNINITAISIGGAGIYGYTGCTINTLNTCTLTISGFNTGISAWTGDLIISGKGDINVTSNSGSIYSTLANVSINTSGNITINSGSTAISAGGTLEISGTGCINITASPNYAIYAYSTFTNNIANLTANGLIRCNSTEYIIMGDYVVTEDKTIKGTLTFSENSSITINEGVTLDLSGVTSFIGLENLTSITNHGTLVLLNTDIVLTPTEVLASDNKLYTWIYDNGTYTLTFNENVTEIDCNIHISDDVSQDVVFNVSSDITIKNLVNNRASSLTIEGEGTLTADYILGYTVTTTTFNSDIVAYRVSIYGDVIINKNLTASQLSTVNGTVTVNNGATVNLDIDTDYEYALYMQGEISDLILGSEIAILTPENGSFALKVFDAGTYIDYTATITTNGKELGDGNTNLAKSIVIGKKVVETTTPTTTDTTTTTNWYTVILSTNGYGEIAPELSGYSSIVMVEGSSYTFLITPNTGYYTLAVYVDGTNIGAVSEYTVDSINADRKIYAVFSQNSVITSSEEESSQEESVEVQQESSKEPQISEQTSAEISTEQTETITSSVLPIVVSVIILASGGMIYFIKKRSKIE